MAVELKDLGEYLGFTEDKLKEFDTPDALKAEVDKQFIRRENALKDKEFKKAVTGELLGSIATKTKSIAKTYGIEFQPEEIKDQPVEKIVELSLSKLSIASQTALEEVKKQISKPDEALKQWEEKYNKLNTSFADTNKLLEATKTEFTSFKEKTASEIKNAKLTFQEEQEFGKIENLFKPNINEVEKIGFRSAIKSRAKFDFDDAGKMIVTDLEGHLIPNKNKHGEFMKPEEFLKEEGLKLGVIPANPHSKPTPKPIIPVPATNGNGHAEVDKTKRKINSFNPMASR